MAVNISIDDTNWQGILTYNIKPGDTINIEFRHNSYYVWGLYGILPTIPGCSYTSYSGTYGGDIKQLSGTFSGSTATGYSIGLGRYDKSSGGYTSGGTIILTNQSLTTYYSNLYYNANGGTGAPSNNLDTKTASTTPSARSITIPATTPTRENYIFKGWSKTSTGSVEYVAGNTISVPYLETNTGITLYAVWEPAPKTKYYSKLSYNTIGGTPTIADDKDEKEDYTTPTARTTTITNTEPSKDNYDFKGWSETKGKTTPDYTKGDNITIPYLTTDTGIVLFAVYEKKKVFKPCFYVGTQKVGIRNINKKIVIGE